MSWSANVSEKKRTRCEMKFFHKSRRNTFNSQFLVLDFKIRIL